MTQHTPQNPLQHPPQIDLLDGEWHRLHPMTPVFRGGIGFIAVVGFLITMLRDTIINIFLDIPGDEWDLSQILQRYFLWLILGSIALLGLAMLMFYFSWRMSAFRVTGDEIEKRSGIFFRTHRRLRLDRVQGININRPIFPKLFGASKFQVLGAGSDAGLDLNYLNAKDTQELRRGILMRAASAQSMPTAAQPMSTIPPEQDYPSGVTQHSQQPHPLQQQYQQHHPSRLEETIDDFFNPELDSDIEPMSLVQIPIPRMIGATLLSGATVFLIILATAAISVIFFTPLPNEARIAVAASFLPGMIGFIAFYVNKVRKMLRYSVAPTRHGVRIGYGLFSTVNETVPPRRVHAIQVSQPLLWRKNGWWQIHITKASSASESPQQAAENATVLPVGDMNDIFRVLQILLPNHDLQQIWPTLYAGMFGEGSTEGYRTATKRARLFQPLTWKRNGWASTGKLGLIRSGILSRHLSIIPLARVQGALISQGPLARSRGLARINIALVPGPVNTKIINMDTSIVTELFAEIQAEALVEAVAEKSERWNDDVR